ncbi:hypothetical protein M422DRAFT_32264, partial [Sphaerobolus stellatus SS14]
MSKDFIGIGAHWDHFLRMKSDRGLVQGIHCSCGLVCVVLIAGFTCYYLLTMKSGFMQINTMVSRLARISVESALGPTTILPPLSQPIESPSSIGLTERSHKLTGPLCIRLGARTVYMYGARLTGSVLM